jgi:hypothetical protein
MLIFFSIDYIMIVLCFLLYVLVTTTASISPTSSHVPSTTAIPGVTTSIHVSSTSVGSTVVLSSPGTTTLIGK